MSHLRNSILVLFNVIYSSRTASIPFQEMLKDSLRHRFGLTVKLIIFGTMAVQESALSSTLPALVSSQLTVPYSEERNSTTSRLGEGDAIYYILLVFGLAGAVVVFKMLDNFSTQKAINRLPFDFFEKKKEKKKTLFSRSKPTPGLVVENRAATGFEPSPDALSEGKSGSTENV